MPGNVAFGHPGSSWTITVSGRRIPIRMFFFWAGAAFWIGNTILHTGSAGITALWSSFLFVTGMIVITSATRTIRLDQVATIYCWGGAMMSVVWLLGYGFTALQPDRHAVSRNLFTPFLEESMKLAPVLFFLWRQRLARLWSMGASDILLLAAASGAGFALVEDAFIQHHFGAWHAVSWLPTTAILGTGLTVGHQTWTALAGVTLGLALLWRPRKPFVYLLGASGFLWSMLDHFRNNISVGRSGFFIDFLNFIGGHGWVTLYLFLFGVIAVVGSDLYAVHGMQSLSPQLKLPELRLPEIHTEVKHLKALWAFLIDRRAFAYVVFRYLRSSDLLRAELACFATILDQHLVFHHSNQGASSTQPALILPIRECL